MMELGTAVLIVRSVGAIALACALFGLYYNFGTFRNVLRSSREATDPPRFREAFYVMSAICVFFYGILGWMGIDFLFGNSERWVVFVVVLFAETIYFLAVGMLWARSTHGMSIAAASGISSGGLMVQLFILFPVWAPVVVWLARQRIVNP